MLIEEMQSAICEELFESILTSYTCDDFNFDDYIMTPENDNKDLDYYSRIIHVMISILMIIS